MSNDLPRQRALGSNGPRVFPIALGCMGMSFMYGPADENESIATIHEALDRGVTLLDTGDYYGAGHNELLIGRALKGRRDKALVSVKFGALRSPDGAWIGIDTRPVAVRNFLAYSLTRLGLDHVDIYRPGRLDPAVPIEETAGAIADLVKAGHVRHLGLSEVGAATIRRAHAVHPVADVQLEYSLMSRSIEASILPACRELGIGITAYGVFCRGLLAGQLPDPDDKGDIRTLRMPRFQPANLPHNLALVETLSRIAAALGRTPAQLAIAWVASRGKDILPLIGTRRRESLLEALDTLGLELDGAALAEIEAAVPAEKVAGTRYDAAQMSHLDSER